MRISRVLRFGFFTILLLILLGFGIRADAQWVRTAPLYSDDPSVIFLAQNGGTIFAGVNDCTLGFAGYRSIDNGNSWQAIDSGISGGPAINGLVRFGGNLFCEAYSTGCVLEHRGFYRSTDDGISWIESDSGIPTADALGPGSNYPDGITNSILSYGTNLFEFGQHGIYRSSDTGRHWMESDSGMKGEIFWDSYSEVDACVPFGRYLFASANTYSDDRFINGALFVSSDSGQTWRETQGSPGFPIFALDTLGKYLFAIRFYTEANLPNGGIYRSSDSGTTWRELNCPVAPVALAVSGTKLFVAGSEFVWAPQTFGDSIYLSTDSGITWTYASDGFPQAPNTSDFQQSQITSLVIANNFLFAGTYDSGVWRRPLSDFTSSVASISSSATAAIFPNPTTGLAMLRGAGEDVVVTNVLGQVVFSHITSIDNETTLDLTDEPPGTYFVHIENGDNSQVLRLAKE